MRAKGTFSKGVTEKQVQNLMPLHPTRVAPPPPPTTNRNLGTLNGNNKNTGHNNNGPQIYTQNPTVIRTSGSNNKSTKKKVPPPRPEPPKNYKQQPIYGFNNNFTTHYTNKGMVSEHFSFTKTNGSYRKRIAPIPSPIRAQIQLKNKLKESLIDLDTPNSSPKHSTSILDLPNPVLTPTTLLDMEIPDIPQPSLLPPLLPLQHQRTFPTSRIVSNGFSTLHSNNVPRTPIVNPSPASATLPLVKKEDLFREHVEVKWPNPEPSVFSHTQKVTIQNIASVKPQPSRSPPAEESKMLVALYDYTSEEADDLEFKEGDTIKLIREINSDWWFGELHGRQGQFPSNFVQVKEENLKSLPPPSKLAPIKKDDKIESSSQIAKSSDHYMVIALYDFPADQEGDLALTVGDQVKVLEEVNVEWYYGECKSVKGQFPSNFVERVQQKQATLASPTLGFVIAMYDFPKEQETDLELKAGDKILVTEHIDANWWRGMAVEDDREGVFPAAFVERLE